MANEQRTRELWEQLITRRTDAINYDWDVKLQTLNDLCEHYVEVARRWATPGLIHDLAIAMLFQGKAQALRVALSIMIDGEAD